MTVPPRPPEDARTLRDTLSRALGADPLLSPLSESIADALHSEAAQQARRHGPFGAALISLLEALRWRGAARDLVEALPHAAGALSGGDALNVMARLGYACTTLRIRHGRFDPRALPALFVGERTGPLVVLEAAQPVTGPSDRPALPASYRILDAQSGETREIAASELSGSLHCFALVAAGAAEDEDERRRNWVAALARRFTPQVWRLLAIAGALNGLALVGVFFMMAIYDTVIPAGGRETLAMLAVGAAGLLALDLQLRQLRARIWAHLGARVDALVSTESFKQLLHLPPSAVEGAPIGAQLARLREFDSIRDLFVGPLAHVALDMPFTLLLLGAIWLIAGPVVWVPIVMLALYAVVGVCMTPALRERVRAAARARAERQALLTDLLRNLRLVKQLAGETRWMRRFEALAAETAHTHHRVVRLTQRLHALAAIIMMGSGVAAIAWSVERVIAGEMSTGALIAVMALTWRLLSPLQSLFLALTRLEQAAVSARQLNHLMRQPIEPRRPAPSRRVQRRINGAVAFERVSFRYRAGQDPALLNVSFALEPGALLAVTGPNGSGKSTLLTLLLAMQRPLSGAIRVDDVDLRQMDVVALRQSVGYVPQQPALFHGTIAQNLRLGQPLARDQDLAEACARIGALDPILRLPEGFDTRIGDQNEQRISPGLRQAIGIARALLKNPRLLLLDESAQLLDEVGSAAFERLLGDLRGRATTLFVSHRPSHMLLADQMMVLERGQLSALGPPRTLLPPPRSHGAAA